MYRYQILSKYVHRGQTGSCGNLKTGAISGESRHWFLLSSLNFSIVRKCEEAK